MVVGAGGCQRAEGLYVHRIRRTTVQNVGVRRQTTGAIGALLPHRHRRHEAVAKGAAIPAAATARANGATHETRVSAGSPAGRPAGSAPRLCNAGGRRGPPGLLFPHHPRQPLANLPPWSLTTEIQGTTDTRLLSLCQPSLYPPRTTFRPTKSDSTPPNSITPHPSPTTLI